VVVLVVVYLFTIARHKLGMLEHLLGICSGNASNLLFLDHDLLLSHGELFVFVVIGTGTNVVNSKRLEFCLGRFVVLQLVVESSHVGLRKTIGALAGIE